jgi:hypothetical protein
MNVHEFALFYTLAARESIKEFGYGSKSENVENPLLNVKRKKGSKVNGWRMEGRKMRIIR